MLSEHLWRHVRDGAAQQAGHLLRNVPRTSYMRSKTSGTCSEKNTSFPPRSLSVANPSLQGVCVFVCAIVFALDLSAHLCAHVEMSCSHTKVRDARLIELAEQNVSWFEISVYDVVGVEMRQPAAHVRYYTTHHSEGERLGLITNEPSDCR